MLRIAARQLPRQLVCPRNFSSKPFIVLDARNSGILPPKRPKQFQRQSADHQHAIFAEIDENQQLLVGDSELSPSEDAVLDSIAAQRPVTTQLSPQRFQQVKKELVKGFMKKQLAAFLKRAEAPVSLHWNKDRLVNAIMTQLWGLEKSSSVSVEDDLFVENTIDLSERNFILAMGSNGALLREWAKSGAKVLVNPLKQQVLIKSTANTYNWVLATLHQMENNTQVAEILASEFSTVHVPTPMELAQIQRLTSTYLSKVGVDPVSQIFVYSRDSKRDFLVKRLLSNLVPTPSKWSLSQHFYDTNSENLEEYAFSEFPDYDSLPWTAQNSVWSRWRQKKRKSPSNLEPFEFRPLEVPSFVASQGDITRASAAQQSSQIVKDLVQRAKASGPMTISATFGFILHDAKKDHVVPNAGMPKTFTSNIPLIHNWASQLGSYIDDVKQEITSEPQSFADSLMSIATESNGSGIAADSEDSWLDAVRSNAVYASRSADLPGSKVNKVLQIKLQPSPFLAEQGENLVHKYPPVELWLPLDTAYERGIDIENHKLVKVPIENHSFVSLAHLPSDIKFSAAVTQDVSAVPGLSGFLNRCSYSPHGNTYIPHEMRLAFDVDDPVQYIVNSHQIHHQVELDFNGKLLQLSWVDGGSLEGRSIEATLVLHYPDGINDVNHREIEDFAYDSMLVPEQLEKLPVHKTLQTQAQAQVAKR